MDALHLREILLKVGKDIRCPLCNTPVSLHNIEITSHQSHTSDCDLNIECDHCQFAFGGRAKLLQPSLPERKKFNASSLVNTQNKVQSFISEEEKQQLHSSLMTGNISFL